MRRNTKQKFFGFLLVAGGLLLFINIWGLFKSMGNPEIQIEENASRIADVSIPYQIAKVLPFFISSIWN